MTEAIQSGGAQLVPARTTELMFGRAGSTSFIMTYTVYVLKDKNGLLYKGMTNCLIRRLREHKNGHIQTTSRMDNPVLIYSEEFDKFEDARKRELYLKTSAGRRFLKTKLPK